MLRSKYWLLILAVLAACTKADKKADGVNGNFGTDGAASFSVKELTGEPIVAPIPETFTGRGNVQFQQVWRVPRVIKYRFRVCVEDRATRQDAAGHKFEIEVPETGRRFAEVSATNRNGCLVWFEDIPFTYFVKQSKWVVLERRIIGKDLHTGSHLLRIAVNPWAVGQGARDGGAGYDAVQFLRKGDEEMDKSMLVAPADADKAFSGELLGEDRLFVDAVNVQTFRKSEVNRGVNVQMNVSMTPKVEFANYAGQQQYRELTSGDFYVIAHLVLDNSGDKLSERNILSAPGNSIQQFKDGENLGIVGQGKVIDGKLVARLNGWVDPRWGQGNLSVAIKLIPKGIKGLSQAQGIFEVGALGKLANGFTGQLDKNCREYGNCEISKYLHDARNYQELAEKGTAAFKGSTYLFDRIRLRFFQVETGETTTERTVVYTASTCVTDAFTGDRPVGVEFKVKDRNTGVERSVKTRDDGCLAWDSKIAHKYYMPEEFIENVATITKGTGVTHDIRFFINPWDDKFTFGFDAGEFGEDFWADQKKRKKIPSRFFMSEFGYHTVRFQYNIDSLMSLEVRKTVLMELSPRVLRYSGIINARKMTEPLRDGIWLLKVGIQKNYLDPSQMGMYIDKLSGARSYLRTAGEPNSPAEVQAASKLTSIRDVPRRLRKLGIEVPSKEYITTQQTLIRSTDGDVVHQVELRMQDLRLMRVRSNFMLQIEPVEERALQAENELHEGFRETIRDVLKQRKAKRDELGKNADDNGQNLDEVMEQEEKRITELVDKRKAAVNKVLDGLDGLLKNRGVTSIDLSPFSLDAEDLAFMKPLMDRLKLRLVTNDHTVIELPSCQEIDCERFKIAPEDSGLGKRSFVGPVIFLSNAYRDAVRATDNIPEAHCGRQIEFDDEFEQDLWSKEEELFGNAQTSAELKRQNTFYNYNEFFGSLRHLCNAHVDDLIAREHHERYIFEKNMPAISSVYNFATSLNTKFMSLSGEKLRKVTITADELKRCNNDLPACMNRDEAITDKHYVPIERGLEWLSKSTSNVSPSIFASRHWGETGSGVKQDAWTREDLKAALFTRKNDDERNFAACALLSRSMAESIRQAGQSAQVAEEVWKHLHDSCLSGQVPMYSFDRKLRVYQTGQGDESYLFLGGYQLNTNVGQSFSVGRSTSYSVSAGLDPMDAVSGWFGSTPLGKGAANFLKPFSVKGSASNSVSQGEGTSVSDSTYLVAQIAKFKVRLDKYEECVALRFRPHVVRNYAYQTVNLFGNTTVPEKFAKTMLQNEGLFVCTGEVSTEPRYVDEHYFYFTQHFTEGDMLDQADLYNHPWLLALRGIRDFNVFMSHVRKQEEPSLFSPVTEFVFGAPKRQVDWPLDQMLQTYRSLTPAFPGYYTVLDDSENLSKFPLESYLSMEDPDVNNEVISQDFKQSVKREEPSEAPPPTLE